MLEKNKKIFYCDSHLHFSQAVNISDFSKIAPYSWAGLSCAHSKEEFENQIAQINQININNSSECHLFHSFGIHPQQISSLSTMELNHQFDYLQQLLSEKKLTAIGETGFDFFTEEYKSTSQLQEEFFIKQINLAQTYNLPVVIHCRKANEKLFQYSKELKKLPAVLFHSFMGTPIEAKSLLDRGINGFFSFGKQVLNNNKKVIACVRELPLNRLLCETDAPYQTLKGESFTKIEEIKTVYEAFAGLRKEIPADKLFQQINMNFSEFCTII